MALPGFRPSIELVSDEQGESLVDRTSGTALRLSSVEAAMLRSWDGTTSAAALADLVLLQGVSLEPRQVEQFFARLERSGLLRAQPPSVPYFSASSPGVEAEEDVVPTLRGDLVITPSKSSRGTLDVLDPTCERSFTLYDFEVSIARMLDGRRTTGEVIVAANRLGIPVTLATLRTFLQQLRAYQFIDANVRPEGDSTWAPRREWTVEVRELYQSALRLMRASRFDEARRYVDAMVAADPSNVEAGALRQRIDAEALGSGELLVPFDDLHTPVSSPVMTLEASAPAPPQPISLKTTPYGSQMLATPSHRQLPVAGAEAASGFEPVSLDLPRTVPAAEPPRPISLKTTPYGISPALAPGIERGGSAAEQLEAGTPLPLTPAPEPQPVEAPSAPAMWPPTSANTADPFAGFGFLSSAPPSAETLTPLPSGLYKKVPDVAAPPPAERRRRWVPALIAVLSLALIAAALLRPVTVEQRVPCELRAQVLATATSPREGVVKRADVKSGEVVEKGAVLARLELSLDDAPAVFEGRIDDVQKELNALPKPAPAKVKKQKLAVKKAELAVKAAQKGLTKLTGAKLALAEKKLALKQKALDKANAQLEALTRDARRAELQQRIDALRAEAETAAKHRERSAIVAPEAGVAVLPEDFPVTVTEGGEFAQLLSPKLSVHADVPADVSKVTLVLGDVERELTVQRAGGAVGAVDFAPELAGQKGSLRFAGGSRPWVTTLQPTTSSGASP